LINRRIDDGIAVPQHDPVIGSSCSSRDTLT
jgi:hypothetical protein